MKLAIFNGSPRGQNSNTKMLLEKFCEGFIRNPDNSFDLFYLKEIMDKSKIIDAILASDAILTAFPLYSDAMPFIVKNFIELLPSVALQLKDKKMLYIVHSGFPEGVHSVYTEHYLKKMTARLNAEYTGTIIRGGTEGIRMMPPKKTEIIFQSFIELGECFGRSGKLDVSIVDNLRKPYRFSVILYPIFFLLKLFGLLDADWNEELRKNGAFEKRFDRPYQ